MDKIKAILYGYKDTIPYLFFGICTTVVNVIAYWMCAHLFMFNITASSITAWILAVLFAYLTNRKWVFKSSHNTVNSIIWEAINFFGCRLVTGLIDLGFMFLFVDIMEYNDVIIKILSNVIVIAANYLASKFYIFK